MIIPQDYFFSVRQPCPIHISLRTRNYYYADPSRRGTELFNPLRTFMACFRDIQNFRTGLQNQSCSISDLEYADDLTRPVAVLAYMYNDQYRQNVDSNATCQSSREFADSADDSFKCQQNLDFMAWMRWLGAELAANPVPAALLGIIIGFEASDDNSAEFPSKVIIPDEVANLPLPHAFWLFGGGIGGWLGLRRIANKARKPSIH